MQADKLDQYALGQRVKKITPAQTLYYHYDEAGQLLAETDSQGNVIRDYIYMDAMRVARYDDTTPYYFHNDHLGRPVALTDAAGAIAWQVDYLPFGKVYTVVNNTTDNELGFPGQILDTESGFFYNYFRDYDPETGRYVQSDPIGVMRDLSDPRFQIIIQSGLPMHRAYTRDVLNHLYAYVEQNPFIYIDPLGLRSLPGLGGAGASSVALGGEVLDNYYLNDPPGDLSDVFYCAWAHCPDEGDQSCDEDDFVDADEWAGNSAPAPWSLPQGCTCLIWARR